MLLSPRNFIIKITKHSQQLSFSKNQFKRLLQTTTFNLNQAAETQDTEAESKKLDNLLKTYEGKIFFSEYLESKKLKLGYERNKIVLHKHEQKYKKLTYDYQRIQPLPISLKYLQESSEEEGNKNNKRKEYVDENSREIIRENNEEISSSHFPFAPDYHTIINENQINKDEANKQKVFNAPKDIASISDYEVRKRFEASDPNKINRWMEEYDSYNDEPCEIDKTWTVNYGTPNPNSTISKVPCGGCGAFLHCRDTSIPGYVPSEIFNNCDKPGGATLRAVICQRCHFLNNFNVALQVNVKPEDYPKVLLTVKERSQALVVLIVDLLDFPCSIWPGLPELFVLNQPIVVVGNKVDLLPQDSRGYLNRVKKVLEDNLKLSGFATTNIKHVGLISAKTGYGVEELVTKLFNLWQYRGDVFLVGCTNVGKSSLFNALLQSDYCKVQAGDLIQRATISPWPGTTLNLLKFPIVRPQGYRLHARTQRLVSANKVLVEERKLRKSQFSKTRDIRYATLIGHIDRTYTKRAESNTTEVQDPFSLNANSVGKGQTQSGIDEKDKDYVLNKWCYDTPGVVQPDQITNLLTAEELVLTFPNTLIRPRTYTVQPGHSIYIGGLARLDFLESSKSARFTIFASNKLPITICETESANCLYKDFLGTEMFGAPGGSKERLKFWPGLKSKLPFSLQGIDRDFSCMDVLLSSAGWIAVTPSRDQECLLKAWTPEARGIHLRESMLPSSVRLRGRRIRNSPAYARTRIFIQ